MKRDDRVWHSGLREWGTFVAVDDWDTDTAYVDFDHQGPLRITRALLLTAKP